MLEKLIKFHNFDMEVGPMMLDLAMRADFSFKDMYDIINQGYQFLIYIRSNELYEERLNRLYSFIESCERNDIKVYSITVPSVDKEDKISIMPLIER